MTSPMIMAMVVVLPAPLPPSRPVIEPCGSGKGHAVHGGAALVDFDQAVGGDGGDVVCHAIGLYRMRSI